MKPNPLYLAQIMQAFKHLNIAHNTFDSSIFCLPPKNFKRSQHPNVFRVISSNLSYRIQGTLKSQIIATVCSMVEALCSPPSCALGVRLGNVFHFMVDWPRGMDEQQHSKSWTKTQADLPYHHRIHVHPNVPPRTHTIATCVAFVFKSRLAGQHNSTQYSLAICSEKEKPVMLRKYMLVRFDCMYIYR